MLKYKDLTGMRFGRLVVIAAARKHRSQNGKIYRMWSCICDCGKSVTVRTQNLVSGHTKSCGCVSREKLRNMNYKHGGCSNYRSERLYAVYRGMIDRTQNEKHVAYKYYGARGITVCDEWKRDYATFRNWAYLNGYDETAKQGDCTIDRIDANGNYEPGNCRWVDMAVQNSNKRQTAVK